MKNIPHTKPEVRYFIGRVTFHVKTPQPLKEKKIPEEYQQHEKVFSEEKSQRLPKHTMWDHAIELLPNAPDTLPA
jgi:hypothetical protein